MHKVHTSEKYDFYYSAACGAKPALYNILTKGPKKPTGGYYSMTWIEKTKGESFPARYRPQVRICPVCGK